MAGDLNFEPFRDADLADWVAVLNPHATAFTATRPSAAREHDQEPYMTSPTQRRHDEILGRLDALIDAVTPGDKQPAPDVDPDERQSHPGVLWDKIDALTEDVERLTRERDEAVRRHEALRADIADRFDTTPYAGTARAAVRVTLVGILRRDDERVRDA